jgi:hypothetical protein
MTAIFADFARPAAEHITAAVSYPGELPDNARYGVIWQLARLTATFARYAADIPLPDEFTPVGRQQMNTQVRAALDARLAFRRAAQALHHAADLPAYPTADDPSPVVRHLAAAADYLAAGRDLLQTHLTPGPSGTGAGRSYWAPVITSPPVTAALLAEIADHARTLAPWAARLSVAGPAGPAVPASALLSLHTATRWLWIAGATVEAAHLTLPSPAHGHLLLHAIPANSPPPRRPPAPGEPVLDLCDGIAVTAERLRHAAMASAGQAGWSPSATSEAWRRGALAAAITSHTADIILHALTERARHLGASTQTCHQLEKAAAAMTRTWPAWRDAAHQWDTVSTGTHRSTGPAPVAGEYADLVLRAGQLAYDNPYWTPASGHASDTRDPADLAPDHATLTSAAAAMHTAADAITCAGAEDREAIRAAAASHRLYKSTIVLPGSLAARRRYRPIDHERTDAILTTYDNAIQATTTTTAALEDLAITLDAPTAILATARRTAAEHKPDHTRKSWLQPPAGKLTAMPDIGRLEGALREHHVNSPSLLARASAVDDAARELLAEVTAAPQRREAITITTTAPRAQPTAPPARSRH